MRIAIDTNAYSDAARGSPRPLQLIEGAEEVYLPFVVLAEMRAGFMIGNRAAANEAKLSRFLQQANVSILLADEQTTIHWARLHAFLRRKGTPLASNDLWIAALVVQHDLALVSSNRDFDRLPQLLRI